MVAEKITSAEAFDRAKEKGAHSLILMRHGCSPCRSQEPILETLAEKVEGKAKVAAMNIDDHREIATNLAFKASPH